MQLVNELYIINFIYLRKVDTRDFSKYSIKNTVGKCVFLFYINIRILILLPKVQIRFCERTCESQSIRFRSLFSLLNTHQTMQQLYINNIFQIFVPVGGVNPPDFTCALSAEPNFGLTLSRPHVDEHWHYQVQLVSCHGDEETSIVGGLSWAKRNPYRIQVKNNYSIEGLILQVKVEAGVFDFRRVKQRLIRFSIGCSNAGVLLSRGISPICQLYPRKRVADDDKGVDNVGKPRIII